MMICHVTVTRCAPFLRSWIVSQGFASCQQLCRILPFGMGCAVQEAAYHSVLVISIPLSIGQEEISQFAVDQGRGIVVRKETLMAGHSQPLLDALRDMVTHNSAYSKQVRPVVMTAVVGSWLFCCSFDLAQLPAIAAAAVKLV